VRSLAGSANIAACPESGFPPCTIEELNDVGFVIKDGGQKLA